MRFNESVVTFVMDYQVKFVGCEVLLFIRFGRYFMLSWKRVFIRVSLVLVRIMEIAIF